MKVRIVLAAVFSALFIAALVLSNGYPLTITSFETKDLSGNPKVTFRKGEIVVVETKISYPAPTYYYYAPPGGLSYLQIIGIYYGGSMTGLSLTRGTINPGESKSFGGGTLIRVTDPSGTYRVKTFVWNGFPSEMGAGWLPLSDIQEKTITVTP